VDNLTHTAVGWMLARAGGNRAGRGATLALLLAANAPDIDIVTAAGGALNYLRHHRGVTHSLAGTPALALVVTALVWLLFRKRGFSWVRMYGVALAGVATHPLLDMMNTYGVRLLEPFVDRWYSWDLMHIVDPWLWVGIFFCVGAAFLGRLISGEIGAAPGSGRRWALAGLALVAAWCGARAVLHQRVVAMLEAHAYGMDGERRPARLVAAFPVPTSPFRWRGLVETDEFYQVLEVDPRAPLDPTRGEVQYKPEPSAALEAARRAWTWQEFARFARYPLVRAEGNRVTATDFRFLRERREAFLCVVEVDEAGRVVEERFRF
jgi:inner membrane protein